MVEHLVANQMMGVRFSLPAQKALRCKHACTDYAFLRRGRIEGERGHPASTPGRASVVRRRHFATAKCRALGRFSLPAHFDSLRSLSVN